MSDIRKVNPTMLIDNAWKFMDFEEWWRSNRHSWAHGEEIKAVTLAYYKGCDACGWADPTTHLTEAEAQEVRHECADASR